MTPIYNHSREPDGAGRDTPDPQTLTLGSLFDGSGGFPLGGLLSGITPVWASEIEPFPIRVTTKRLPFMKHYGDVSRMDGGKIEPVDIITFGSPCQDMSIAGRREGLDGSRSSLFYEAVRIVKEMRCATDGRYPRYIVWENVPGAFSSNKGADFQSVLEEICSAKGYKIDPARPAKWPAAGEIVADDFSLAWRVFDAQYWGVPQRRKRIYLVHDFGSGRAGQILFECESLLGYHPAGGGTAEGNTADLENSTAGTDCGGLAEDAGGQLTLDFGRTADRIYINAKQSVTLMGRAGGGGGKTGLYLLPVYTIIGNIIGRTAKSGGNGKGFDTDISPTLTTADRHAIAYPENLTAFTQSGYAEFKEGVGTLKKSRGAAGGGSETLVVQTIKKIAQAVKYRVRRLTPLECERLDGFPDGWTQYGASGKEMSDNARYMALGNSIAAPCAERVFIGICKAERQGENESD